MLLISLVILCNFGVVSLWVPPKIWQKRQRRWERQSGVCSCFRVLIFSSSLFVVCIFWVDVILPKFVERLFQDIRARAEKCRTSRCRDDVAFAKGPHAMLAMPPPEFLREKKVDKRLLRVAATGKNLLLCNCPVTRVCCCMQILYHWWL